MHRGRFTLSSNTKPVYKQFGVLPYSESTAVSSTFWRLKRSKLSKGGSKDAATKDKGWSIIDNTCLSGRAVTFHGFVRDEALVESDQIPPLMISSGVPQPPPPSAIPPRFHKQTLRGHFDGRSGPRKKRRSPAGGTSYARFAEALLSHGEAKLGQRLPEIDRDYWEAELRARRK